MSHAYPTVLPLDCAQTVFKAVSTRTVKENLKPVANCAWWLSGYIMGVTIGQPDDAVELFSCDGPCCDDEKIQELCDTLPDLEEQLKELGHPIAMASGPQDAEAVNPATVLMIVQFCITLAKSLGWIKKKNPA